MPLEICTLNRLGCGPCTFTLKDDLAFFLVLANDFRKVSMVQSRALLAIHCTGWSLSPCLCSSIIRELGKLYNTSRAYVAGYSTIMRGCGILPILS